TDIEGNELNIDENEGVFNRNSSGNCMLAIRVACYGSSCPCTDGNGQTFYVTVPCSGGGGGNSDGGGDPGSGGPLDPGGFPPTDPHPGGGGSQNSDPEKTPCQIGKALKTNPTFRNKMTTLKTSAQNDNFEKGFLMKLNSGANHGYDYIEVNGPVNGDGIDLNLQSGDQYAGFIHSHYDRDDMLSVFSLSDILKMYLMFEEINMTQPEKNFFMGVVTADNT